MFHHIRDLSEGLRGRILEIPNDSAVYVEAQHKRKAFDVRLEKRRQAPDDLPEEGTGKQEIEARVPAIDQRQPKSILTVPQNAVGESRKIIDEDVRLA